MFGQVLGLHHGVAQLQQEGFLPTLRPEAPPRGYLSGKYGTMNIFLKLTTK